MNINSKNLSSSIGFIAITILLSGCSIQRAQPYKDNFPQPCTQDWFIAIEAELNLVDANTNRPPPGSIQWLNAADERLSLSEKSGFPVGDTEWCHQLHQEIIGL